MATRIFMTGFPGFIAKQLVRRLVEKNETAAFTFLIQERMRPIAETSLEGLEAAHPGLSRRSRLIAGDLVQPRLGMDQATYGRETADVTHVWHLAAVYDLHVPAAVAYRVNVIGSANTLDFCEACPQLVRLDYVSTCYVSGLRTGRVFEHELDEGQGFKNHYESTKCWAEMEVRRRTDRIPVCIHRPGVVVGNSHTGHTDKYDGPYFIIGLLLRLPSWLPMVNLGNGKATVNLVPVDFVVAAMAELSQNDKTIGSTVQLADPSPHTVKEVMGGIMHALGRRRPLGQIPPRWVERALEVGSVRHAVKVPREAVVYFNHPVEYDTANQQKFLASTAIRCPDFLDIVPTLVDYVRQNPDKPFLDDRQL